MKIQFVLELDHELIDEEKFSSLSVVETYRDCDNPYVGYEVIEVEAEKISDVKIRMGDGKVYMAEAAQKFKFGWYITIWTPVEGET